MVHPGPQPAFGPPPRKQQPFLAKGCWVALGIVLFLMVSFAGVVFYIGYRLSKDKDVQRIMGAIGDGAKIMAEAQTAPGTNELRALGCEQAMAIDMDKMAALGGKYFDAGVPPAAVGKLGMMVTCQVGLLGTAPTCDDAAKAYARGASPSRGFMMAVQSNNKAHQCTAEYDASGSLVRVVPSHGGAGGP